MQEDADRNDLPQDLRETAGRLRDGRPSWTDAELDGIKLRAMKRVAGAARSRSVLTRLARSALFTPQLAIGVALVALVALGVGGAVRSNIGPLTLASCGQYDCPATQVAITSSALDGGTSSSSATLGPITVQLQNATGGGVITTGPVQITLSTTSSGGVFSSTSGPSTSHTLVVTIPSGSSTNAANSAYYGDATAGNPTITATDTDSHDTGLSPGAQTETIFGSASKLVFSTPPVGGVAEGAAFGTSPKVSVEDSNGNVVTSFSGSVTLAIASTGGYIAGNGGTTEGTLACTNTGTNGLTATASGGTATFTGCNITGTAAAGTYKLTASGDSFTTPASSGVTINAGSPSVLSFINCVDSAQSINSATCAGQPYAMGNTSTLTANVQLLDSNGNVATTPSQLTVNLANSNTSDYTVTTSVTVLANGSQSGQLSVAKTASASAAATVTASATGGYTSATLQVKK